MNNDDALVAIFIIATTPGGRQGEEECIPVVPIPTENASEQCRGGEPANGWGGSTHADALCGPK